MSLEDNDEIYIIFILQNSFVHLCLLSEPQQYNQYVSGLIENYFTICITLQCHNFPLFVTDCFRACANILRSISSNYYHLRLYTNNISVISASTHGNFHLMCVALFLHFCCLVASVKLTKISCYRL